jgi:hypothetical protein
MQDLPGTAQGIWYRAGAPSLPEDPHLALAHDNVDPTLAVISVGTSVTGLSAGAYGFTLASSGRANRDFTAVVPAAVYCWDLTNIHGSSSSPGRLVAAFADLNDLSLRYDAATPCGTGPWTIGTEGIAFVR